MRWQNLDREACSVARTMAVIGDRWTMLILRECFNRVRRFEDFQSRLGITRHLLADRLRKLAAHGVLRRELYQERPPRYEYRLTDKGLALHPVMLALVHWGDVHATHPDGRPQLHRHKGCGHIFDPVTTCSVCGERVGARDVWVEPGPGATEEGVARITGRPAARAARG